MPEGPEIALMSNYLNKKIKGKTIIHTEVYSDSKYLKNDFRYLEEKQISFVDFKGKKIIFVFTDNTYFVSSLGLEGKWEYLHSIEEINKRNLSFSIEFDDSSYIAFWDQRHFGNLLFCKSLECLNHIGPSWIPSKLFPEVISKKDFFRLMTNKRLNKKSIMMFLNDQKYTSGIGTYIRADVLYLSKINPFRLINTITELEANTIYDNIIKIMKISYNNGGTDGGYKCLVYGKTKSTDNNIDVIKEFDSQKRNIYWCPSIQL